MGSERLDQSGGGGSFSKSFVENVAVAVLLENIQLMLQKNKKNKWHG